MPIASMIRNRPVTVGAIRCRFCGKTIDQSSVFQVNTRRRRSRAPGPCQSRLDAVMADAEFMARLDKSQGPMAKGQTHPGPCFRIQHWNFFGGWTFGFLEFPGVSLR